MFDHFAEIQRHHPTREGQHVQVFEPQLTPLQEQLLDLLDVPADAYRTTPGR